MLTREELARIGVGMELNDSETIKNRPDWDRYYLDMCDLVARRSPDLNTKYGAILVRGTRLIACGYNGFPSGVDDFQMPNKRDLHRHKWKMILHAEDNLLLYCAKYGVSTDGCVIYLQGHPCSMCCEKLITAGIKDWIIGTREYQADEEEIIRRKFWVETCRVNIKIIK